MGRALAHDWFPAALPDNVEVGEGSWIHSSYVFLHFCSERSQAVVIGRRTGVYIDTFFDLGPRGEVAIGDACTLAGPIFSTDGRVAIGDRAIVSREVLFADRPATTPPVAGGDRGRRGAASEPSDRPPDIVCGDDVWIGTRAVLLPGARIGDGAVVGAATVVDFELPPFAVAAGNPARIVGRVEPGRRAPGSGRGSPGYAEGEPEPVRSTMTEREQEEREPATSPSEETKDATTPPGSGERDEEAVDRGEDKLDQAGGGH